MKKVLIAADEVDKWSQLCEGLKNEWECTTVNLDVFEKFHTIAVYDAVLMLVRNDNGKLGRYNESAGSKDYSDYWQFLELFGIKLYPCPVASFIDRRFYPDCARHSDGL